MSVCHELSVSSPCLRQRAPSHSTHVCELTVSTTACVKSQHTCLQHASSHSTQGGNSTRQVKHRCHKNERVATASARQVTEHMSTTARANVKLQHNKSKQNDHLYHSRGFVWARGDQVCGAESARSLAHSLREQESEQEHTHTCCCGAPTCCRR